jgi:hypothetical protein
MDCDEVLLMEGISWEKQQAFMVKKRSFPGTKALGLEELPVLLKEVNTVFGIRDWKLVGCKL